MIIESAIIALSAITITYIMIMITAKTIPGIQSWCLNKIMEYKKDIKTQNENIKNMLK